MLETEYLLHSRLPVVFALWADEDGRLHMWHSYVVLPMPETAPDPGSDWINEYVKLAASAGMIAGMSQG